MQEIIELVVKRTGIAEEQAEKAVETVLEFVKGKLPDAIAKNFDQILAGSENVDLDQLGNIANTLGGLFGKKK